MKVREYIMINSIERGECIVKNYVVENYENYREEDRLSTNNARRIEYLTTVRILDELIGDNRKILDCAAGTGIYAFHFAEQENDVTATDITPRHVEIMDETIALKGIDMKTAVLDACDMSIFDDESFDVVLNMGPFYHLIDEDKRAKCLSESLRVLKKDGILVTAYIPRYYIFQLIAMQNDYFLDANLANQLISTGVLRHDDEKCFWTDTYYSSADEMKRIYRENGLTVIDHFAQDGMTPQFCEKVDKWSEEQFKIWCSYHYTVCREKSTLGASNHVVIVGRK